MPQHARQMFALSLAAVAVVTVLAIEAHSQTATPTNSLPNPYRSIDNWAQLPEGRNWGSTSAVDIDVDGTSVWVGERCGAFAPPNQLKAGVPFACEASKLLRRRSVQKVSVVRNEERLLPWVVTGAERQ